MKARTNKKPPRREAQQTARPGTESDQEAIKCIRRFLRDVPNLVEFAETHDFSVAYLKRVRDGVVLPADRVARVCGYRRFVTVSFERLPRGRKGRRGRDCGVDVSRAC